MRRAIILAGCWLLSLCTTTPRADEVSEIVRRYRQMRGQVLSADTTSQQTVGVKCGFGLCLQLMHFKDELGDAFYSALVARPTMQTSVATAHFRVHYDTTGTNVPYRVTEDIDPANGVPDYVDNVAAIFEHVWMVEIESLGYSVPPTDGSAGGDSRYDVYIVNLGAQYYGLTQPETRVDIRRWTSFIELENDFVEQALYRDRPLDAARVTAAHEFFHAIHYGLDSYEYHVVNNMPKPWWYEVTSVWMEDVVYDSVNDYLMYLRSFFDHPEIGLGEYSTDYAGDPVRSLHPYGACVWARYLHERFDRDVIRKIWLSCAAVNGYNLLFALDDVLSLPEYGSSFRQAFQEFASWCYFTGNRADTMRKFSEANLWPQVDLHYVTDVRPHLYPVGDTFASIDTVPEPLGINYLRFRTWSFADGGLFFDFDGEDFSDGEWAVGVLGWSAVRDTFLVMTVSPGSGMGILGVRDWWLYSYLILIPSVFSQTPGYRPRGYSFVASYDSALVGGAPLLDSLPALVAVKATSCTTLTLGATSPLGDTVRFYTPDSLTSGIQLIDNHDNSGLLTYCPPMEQVGRIVQVRIYAANAVGYDARLVSFEITSPVDKPYVYIYPNPAVLSEVSQLRLRYFLPDTVSPGEIDIRIYNAAGDQVYRFREITQYGKGLWELPWNGCNDAGHLLAGGVYFIKMAAGGKSGSGKFAIIR